MDDEFDENGNQVEIPDPVVIEPLAMDPLPDPTAASGDDEEIHGIPVKLKPRFDELRSQAKKAKEFEAELTTLREEAKTSRYAADEYRRFTKYLEENPEFAAHMKSWKKGAKPAAKPAEPSVPAPTLESLDKDALAKEKFDTEFANLDKLEQSIVNLELKERQRDYDAHAKKEVEDQEEHHQILATFRSEIEEAIKGPEFKGIKGIVPREVYDYMIATGINNGKDAARLMYFDEIQKGALDAAERKALERQASAPSAPESPSGVQPPDAYEPDDFVDSVMEQLAAGRR